MGTAEGLLCETVGVEQTAMLLRAQRMEKRVNDKSVCLVGNPSEMMEP